ncbi:MAG: hypothetical protein UR70_C0018G0016 [Candidatus Nomurabacteria bacterium GW2011_GWB1_35_20]|uniref:Uncharacterized protein n=1 Tax=Candidatus Nomurabacteria bacterium GW2011_GWB1_35_20 TaxID=1618740 RepID=A0A0G0C6Q9_9BACT|nr:MAG: hypothetical protein UR70_C0018G0016 [Candidatus Nomurabacteria bacterium GW2011_GWB1_35_20]
MNDMLARQKARAVGKITTALLLNDPSEEDLRVINSLPDATIKRRVKTIYFPGVKGLVKKVEGVYPESLLEFHDGWVEFYKNFGITIDLNDFPLPKNIIKAFELRKQITSVYEYTSVSKIIDVYPRIKVSVIKANLDTKVEYPNVSLNKSMELGLFGTTFTEGCLIDGRVFKDSGVHLDVSSWTLHTGSRGSDGRVPRSRWLDVEFNVRSYNPDYASPYLSLRQKQF